MQKSECLSAIQNKSLSLTYELIDGKMDGKGSGEIEEWTNVFLSLYVYVLDCMYVYINKPFYRSRQY